MTQAELHSTRPAHVSTGRPIFVLGVAPRCGTNFVRDLLCLHPDCDGSRPPVFEDYLLRHAELLALYSRRVHASWHPRWNADEALRDELQQRLGAALVSFLYGPADNGRDDPRRARLVTKTPSVDNLPLFFDLFPDAFLVLVVRDGRSVVHSRVLTAGRQLRPGAYFDRVTREWAEGAEAIAQFAAAHHGQAQRWHIVRYEALVRHHDHELAGLLDFAGLEGERYDFATARALPVRGSSTDRGAGRGDVHWHPLRKDATFDPLKRWGAWDDRLLDRFDWLAGEQLEQLGYERSPHRARAVTRRVAQTMRDVREHYWRGALVPAASALRRFSAGQSGGRWLRR